jgi:hypothetical protein
MSPPYLLICCPLRLREANGFVFAKRTAHEHVGAEAGNKIAWRSYSSTLSRPDCTVGPGIAPGLPHFVFAKRTTTWLVG